LDVRGCLWGWQEAQRLSDSGVGRLLGRRRLSLVVDLDHTVLHTTTDARQVARLVAPVAAEVGAVGGAVVWFGCVYVRGGCGLFLCVFHGYAIVVLGGAALVVWGWCDAWRRGMWP